MDGSILRVCGDDGKDKELSTNVKSKSLKNLEEKLGFWEALMRYCFRQMVLNAVDGLSYLSVISLL